MRYLITGGAGFIGSHLADALLERGDQVHVVDNLSTGRLENIRHLAGREDFSLTIGSVLDYPTLERAIVDCDRVVHLAAAVGVKLIMEQPVGTLQANVGGTENVLRLAHYHDKKALVASTSEVYGKAMQKDDGLDALGEEDDWTLGPTEKRRWAYACSKAMDEFLAQAYYDEKGLEVVCARFFNTVGPRQSGSYGMVVPTFVERALSEDPLEVHGDGTQSRCFLHVTDAVEAILGLLEAPEAVGEVVNVGRPAEISINDLAERILELTGSAAEIKHVPYEEVYGEGFEDMQRRTPDISKLRALTGVKPTRTTDDILRDVIAYEQKQNGRAEDEEGLRAELDILAGASETMK
jgi:UDP-glucose 4-epimerase